MILRFDCIDDDVQVNECKLNILKVQNQNRRFEIMKSLGDNSDKKISLFTDTYDLMNTDNNILFIGDPLGGGNFLESISPRLRKDIYFQFNAIEKEDIQKLIDDLADKLRKRMFMYDLPTTISEDVNAYDLLKLFRVKINSTELQTAYDTMSAVFKVVTKFFQKRIIIVNNLANYFTNEELNELNKECQRLKLTVLFLN